jgi:pimeloyl-CoA synthetase
MRYLKSYKIFESHSDVLEYMYILTDNEPEIVFESSYGILICDLNRKTECDKDDIEAVRSALEENGWSILNMTKEVEKIRHGSQITLDDTIYLSLIRTDFLEELKSKNVKFWKDLEWQDWHLNKSTGSECLQARVDARSKTISIVDGTVGGNNQIAWIEICDLNTGEDYRFQTYIEAEVQLIILQRRYKP